MQYIGIQVSEVTRYADKAGKISWAWFARDCDPHNPKLEARRDRGKRCISALSSGEAVAHNSDMVAASGLSAGDIENVTNNAADGRARHMHDFERPMRQHDQNQRSVTLSFESSNACLARTLHAIMATNDNTNGWRSRMQIRAQDGIVGTRLTPSIVNKT